MIGTEIQGSCQRVNGDPSLNKCLIGYLLNGEVLPIVAKDKNGVLVARCLLRLMWDSKNNMPVLLQERLYSNTKNAIVKEKIDELAIEKAKKMGIPLVSKEIGSGDPYNGKVEFLGGGLAPFIYSDAGDGDSVKDTSKSFEVTGAHVLFDPKSRTQE